MRLDHGLTIECIDRVPYAFANVSLRILKLFDRLVAFLAELGERLVHGIVEGLESSIPLRRGLCIADVRLAA